MSDPFWPWWAVITFFGSGMAWGWLLTLRRRPDYVECPDCGTQVRSHHFRDHWKACLS